MLTDGVNMQTPNSISYIDSRIAIIRDNIRQLIEQAAAFSGGRDEELAADRIAQQTLELESLIKERDTLLAAK